MLVAENVLFEGFQLGLDALLLGSELGGVTLAHLCQRLAQHVVGLIDGAIVAVQREVVVHRHRGGIVQIAGHDGLTTEVGLQVGVFHPEQRIFRGFTTEVVFAQHDGAEAEHFAVE